MKPGYEPTTIGGSLAWLDEESSEVSAAVLKTLRFARERGDLKKELFSYNPDVPVAERETNLAWILREASDLQLALNAFHAQIAMLPCISGMRDCGWGHDRTFTCARCKKLVCYCQGYDTSKSCVSCSTRNRKKKPCSPSISPKTKKPKPLPKRSPSKKSTQKRAPSRSR